MASMLVTEAKDDVASIFFFLVFSFCNASFPSEASASPTMRIDHKVILAIEAEDTAFLECKL